MTTTEKPALELTKVVMQVTPITEEQIRSENREYNASAWDDTISRFAKYKDCKFYKQDPTDGYPYARYYAVYQIKEGLILMNEVSYSSSITNRGFSRVGISMDGTVRRFLFGTGDNIGYADNTMPNRRLLAKESQAHGFIFSTKF